MNVEPRHSFSLSAFVVLLLYHLMAQVAGNDDGDDQACKDLKKPGSDGKFEVLCVGMLRKKMLMVTTSWMVYDLPMDSLSSAINKLYLNGSKPILLQQKWPKLTNSKEYQGSYKQMYNCFTAVDNVGDYLIGTVHESQGTNGWAYDMSKDAVGPGYPYHGKDIQVLISSNQLKSFYAINHGADNSDKGIRIMRYHFTGDTVLTSDGIFPDVDKTFYRLCQVGKSEMKMAKSDSEQCDPLVWPVLKGFIADGNFYLFGGNYIFTFPASVYEKDNVPVTFQSISMNDFIQCSGNISEEERAVAVKSSQVLLGLIIAIVLLIVIILLCCLLCLMREAMQKKNKKEKDASGDAPANAYGKMSIKGRSSISPAFGLLTGQTHPKSASKRLLKLSSKKSKPESKKSVRSQSTRKFGNLSKDKSKAKSTKSARSDGLNKAGALTKKDKSKKPSSKHEKGSARSRLTDKPKNLTRISKSKPHSTANPQTARSNISKKKH